MIIIITILVIIINIIIIIITTIIRGRKRGRAHRGSLSLNVHEELDQGEENETVMEVHFNEVIIPLAAEFVAPVPLSPRKKIPTPGSPGHGSLHI
jgi:hypothetical protein